MGEREIKLREKEGFPGFVEIRPFKSDDEESVIALWWRCDLIRPWNDPHRDIERKLRVRPEWFLVGILDGEIVATVMVGYEGHRGWLNYLAVTPEFQRRGFARTIVVEAERLLLAGSEKRPSAAFPLSFVVAAYVQVRLWPTHQLVGVARVASYSSRRHSQNFGGLASGHF